MTEKETDLQNLADAEKIFEDGLKCCRRKEYDLALNLFNKAIELREKAGDAEYIRDDCVYELFEYYTTRADCYCKKRDYDSAFADYTKSLELGSFAAYYDYHCRAKINFYHKKDYDSAITDFTKAVEDCGIGGCKGCANALYMRGRAYLAKSDYHNAVKSFKMALGQRILYILKMLKYNCNELIKKLRS